jgi:hypothetical protein
MRVPVDVEWAWPVVKAVRGMVTGPIRNAIEDCLAQPEVRAPSAQFYLELITRVANGGPSLTAAGHFMSQSCRVEIPRRLRIPPRRASVQQSRRSGNPTRPLSISGTLGPNRLPRPSRRGPEALLLVPPRGALAGDCRSFGTACRRRRTRNDSRRSTTVRVAFADPPGVSAAGAFICPNPFPRPASRPAHWGAAAPRCWR